MRKLKRLEEYDTAKVNEEETTLEPKDKSKLNPVRVQKSGDFVYLYQGSVNGQTNIVAMDKGMIAELAKLAGDEED